jgi:peptidoglycan/LPS O-acetylase OafA/YrhL
MASATSNPTPRRWLPGLDALRALSIAWVVIFHLRQRENWNFAGWAGVLASSGLQGVTVFFVISGFLITTLLLNEEEDSGRISLSAFYLRRAFRILPAALAYLAVAVVITLALGLPFEAREWLADIFFFRNYIPEEISGLTGHYWSLSVEEQFYLVWPALLVLAPRKARLPATAALCLFAPAWRHIATKLAHGGPLLIGRADLNYDSLLIGALLALLQRRADFRAWLDRRWAAPVALVVAVAAWLLLLRYGLPGGKLGVVLRQSATLLCIAVVVKVLVEGRCPPVQAVCAWHPVVHLGKLSYSLYLWQTLFCTAQFAGPLWRFPWCIAAALACAVASHHWIEKPMLRLRDRRRS